MAPVTIEVPESSSKECKMPAPDVIDPVSAGLLTQHALLGAQRQADGAAAYAENLRYDYLEGKNTVDFNQAQGVRYVVESGAGRTRAETNNPSNTAAPGGTG